MHSPSQAPAIHSYPVPFSLLALHANFFLKQSFLFLSFRKGVSIALVGVRSFILWASFPFVFALLTHSFLALAGVSYGVITYIRGGGSLGSIVSARVILVFVNAYRMCPRSLVLPAFDDSGSLGSLPRPVVYPSALTLGDCLQFLAGNGEAELKPITFSSLLLFRVFLSFLFSWPLSDIVPLCCLLGLLNNNNNNNFSSLSTHMMVNLYKCENNK